MHKQSGVFLLEALVAILIFAFGALGMLAMSSAAISGQTDAQVRTDAANLADQLAGQIALNVDRSNHGANLPASVASFIYNADNTTSVLPSTNAYCSFPSVANATTPIAAWVAAVTAAGGLPGATASSLSVYVDTSADNQNAVTITECWKGPHDTSQRRYMTTVYINY